VWRSHLDHDHGIGPRPIRLTNPTGRETGSEGDSRSGRCVADEDEFHTGDEALLISQAEVMVSHGMTSDGTYVLVLMRLIDGEGTYVDSLMSPSGARELGEALIEFGTELPDWDDPVD